MTIDPLGLRVRRVIVRLEPDEPIVLNEPIGSRITCEQGTVWLTVDGQLADVVLEPGQSFNATTGAKLMLQAMPRAQVLIDAPAAQSIARRRLERWTAKLTALGQSERHSAPCAGS